MGRTHSNVSRTFQCCPEKTKWGVGWGSRGVGSSRSLQLCFAIALASSPALLASFSFWSPLTLWLVTSTVLSPPPSNLSAFHLQRTFHVLSILLLCKDVDGLKAHSDNLPRSRSSLNPYSESLPQHRARWVPGSRHANQREEAHSLACSAVCKLNLK